VLLEWTGADPGIAQLLNTLERYATDGRFYNLDLLGGFEQGESPQNLWEELQQMVIEANPELLEQLAGEDRDVARGTMNRVLALSFGAWCELIKRSWATGVCGDEARTWSPQLDLGHEVPPAINRLLGQP
jgi:hypothetical protein